MRHPFRPFETFSKLGHLVDCVPGDWKRVKP
jgi:hypothetical protein